MNNTEIYTESMLASKFNVTTISPYEHDFEEPIPIKGRKSYNDAVIVFICVSENKAYGHAASLTLLVNKHYRKLQWRMLTDKEKIRVQKALGI